MLTTQKYLRPRNLLLGLAVTLSLYFLSTHGGWALEPKAFAADILSNSSRPTHSPNKGFSNDLVAFWKGLAIALEDARPTCPEINVTKGEMSNHDKKWEPLKEKKRPNRITLPEDDELELTKKHRRMRIAARQLGPTLAVGEGTGIVTTGGLKLVPVLLVSLRMLRRTGCTLPVEVFLGDQDEYKEVADVCENVLPGLNAQCKVISDIYHQAQVDPPDHFQFKVLAILFSSFKHVLFLDADAMPAHDPVPLFEAPPYTTHGLVIWGGFYANAASDHFYHIAGIPVPPLGRGSETGQILLNKDHHREALLMMVYYNYYGPKYYYRLQAQGGPGQGDKETFSTGTMAVSAPGPFYYVRTPAAMLGIHVDGKFVFAGAAQADPMQDYMYEPPAPNHIMDEYGWEKDDAIGAKETEKKKARAFFVHNLSSDTKLVPKKLLAKGGLAYDKDNNWHRIWGTEEWIVEKFGYDVEKMVWECVQEEACRTDGTLCEQYKQFRKKVFG
ncbi:glycosyltransferase family 71 protein [Amniculicola lignicola CBS 123094]|uniref:Glycosyltransferase family 71 protein n=1 Tax=Amniculicola lignicola CBS 123094 TaxID=1392246 RepID=A0A6A5VZQ1_9PLEO|nr:glycosyltransferase family 71 protein [Amniculicola lignicola CBS 123094]